MQPYVNLSRDSGVRSYEIGADRISVQFHDGPTYVYTYSSAGKTNVEQMKKLAVAGTGLCTFINQHVKKLYASRH